MPQLARLGLFVAQSERERKPPREGSAAQVEHPRAFDAAVADERDVGRAATDVDEDPALGPDLLVGARPRQGVWLRDGGGEFEVELTDDGLDGVDVSPRRKR